MEQSQERLKEANRQDALEEQEREEVLRILLGLTSAAIARARRDGMLRYSRQGNSLLYRGTWLLTWLERDADRRQEVRNA